MRVLHASRVPCRVALSRLLPADPDAIHAHRGPCYFAALNHPLLFSYAAVLFALAVSAITRWLAWYVAHLDVATS